MKHYVLPSDVINKRCFEMYVPAYYLPNMPDELVNKEREPLKKVNTLTMVPTRHRPATPTRPMIDPNQIQRANWPINVMLDMFRKKVEFQLAHESDTPDILDAIDHYLISLKQDVESGDEIATTYATDLIAFRKDVYKHFYRYMKLNPTAMQQLYPNGKPNQNLVSILLEVGGFRGKDLSLLDPLKARSIPPYQINPDRHGGSSTGAPGEVTMEVSLGISAASALLNGDDKSFDFEDFLRKS